METPAEIAETSGIAPEDTARSAEHGASRHPPEEAPMAVTTRPRTRFVAQRLFAIAICLVLGLWGVYDYVYKIPARQALADRGEVYRAVKHAIDDAVQYPAGSPEAMTALAQGGAAIRSGLEPLIASGRERDSSTVTLDQAFFEELRSRNEDQWFRDLLLMDAALAELARQRPGGQPLSEDFDRFYQEFLKDRIDRTGAISRPSDFDRLIQWAFILCLPFVPFLVIGLIAVLRVRYRLEEDGTLHYPGGTLAAQNVAGVDMTRWMSKSIAEVIASDGRRIRLDDFVHQHADAIVGAIAHRVQPDLWTPEARPVKPQDAVEAPPAAAPAELEESRKAAG